MALNDTAKPKPTGIFTAWCAVKRCPDTQRIILLDPRTPMDFDVVNPDNFQYPHENGDVRLIHYEREDTSEGQVVRLLKIQSYVDDTSVFSAISVN